MEKRLNVHDVQLQLNKDKGELIWQLERTVDRDKSPRYARSIIECIVDTIKERDYFDFEEPPTDWSETHALTILKAKLKETGIQFESFHDPTILDALREYGIILMRLHCFYP